MFLHLEHISDLVHRASGVQRPHVPAAAALNITMPRALQQQLRKCLLGD